MRIIRVNDSQFLVELNQEEHEYFLEDDPIIAKVSVLPAEYIATMIVLGIKAALRKERHGDRP